MSLPIGSKDSAHLAWDTKPRRAASPKDIEFQTAEVVIPNPAKTDQSLISFAFAPNSSIEKSTANRLIWGDNLLAMQALLASGYEEKIKLVYVDPPFWTGEDYYADLTLGGQEIRKSPSIIERLAYKDYWVNGIDSYLDMLFPRLQLMRRLLRKDGSIFIHSDYHAGHYVKVLSDEIFGRDNFVNEIVWKRRGGHANISKQLGNVTDVILWYSKSVDYDFHPVYSKKGTEDFIKKRFVFTDENGRRFMKSPLNNPAPRPTLRYEYKGYKPPKNGWAISREKMEQWEREGKLFFPEDKSQRINRKIYLDEWKGHPVQSLWTDISTINSMSLDRQGFPTQKPVELISRILELATEPGDIVFDPACGSGTTLIAAETKNLRWLGCDFSKTAIQIARNRLVSTGSRPFVLENIGNYQRHLIYLQQARIYEMQTIVLKLYGATPRNDMPDLGIKRAEDGKVELVYVSYPDRAVTANKTAELAQLADDLDGSGYDKLVILGWDYEYNYDEILEERKKNVKKRWHVQVLSKNIPPEVYDYLRKLKTENELDSLKGKIYFHDKPLLKLQKPKIEKQRQGYFVSVGIDKYVLFDYPIEDPKQKMELASLLQDKPLAIVDYWAIDWNYDGNTFRSMWQALRRNGNKVGIVPSEAQQLIDDKGARRVAVRVVDVFGNDAGSSLSLKLD